MTTLFNYTNPETLIKLITTKGTRSRVFLFLISTLVLFGALIPQLGFANPELKEKMKIAGGLFKQIVQTHTDPNQNTSNQQAALQLSTLFQQFQSYVPSKIAQLPELERENALRDYRRLINLESEAALRLADAFRTSNNALIVQLINLMKELRKEGHSKFSQH